MVRRRKSRLDEYQSIISDWHRSKLSHQEILDRIQEELEIIISLRQLRTKLIGWGLRTNGSAEGLEQFQTMIMRWYLQSGYSVKIITGILQGMDVNTSCRTVERKLQAWKVQKHIRISPENTPLIRSQIYHLFVNYGYDDSHILTELEQSGHAITIDQVVRTRRSLGLTLRMDAEKWEQAKEQARAIIQEELSTGLIDSYGRTYLTAFFRNKGLCIGR
jgi:hypothetical protein